MKLFIFLALFVSQISWAIDEAEEAITVTPATAAQVESVKAPTAPAPIKKIAVKKPHSKKNKMAKKKHTKLGKSLPKKHVAKKHKK